MSITAKFHACITKCMILLKKKKDLSAWLWVKDKAMRKHHVLFQEGIICIYIFISK